MKRVILAAMAATLMHTPVSAIELPDGVTCTDLFWHTKSTINKQELTDYDKCVISTNWPDKKTGTIGDIVWVLVEGDYYSANMRTLYNNFKNTDEVKNAFHKYISNKINQKHKQ